MLRGRERINTFPLSFLILQSKTFFVDVVGVVFSLQSLDEAGGANGRPQYSPVWKEPHEETALCGSCLEEESSCGESFVVAGAGEGERQRSRSE